MIVSILDPGHLSYIVAPDVNNCGGDNCSKLPVRFLAKRFSYIHQHNKYGIEHLF